MYRISQSWLFYKSNSVSFIDKWFMYSPSPFEQFFQSSARPYQISMVVAGVYLWSHGTTNSASISQFGRCHPHYLICSKFLDALNFYWKICLLLGQHTLDGISHKSPHKYHNLPMPGFGSTGKLYFCQYLWNSWDLVPWICCFPLQT